MGRGVLGGRGMVEGADGGGGVEVEWGSNFKSALTARMIECQDGSDWIHIDLQQSRLSN